MISNRFIKKVPKISELEDKYSATVYDSKMPFSAVRKGLIRLQLRYSTSIRA